MKRASPDVAAEARAALVVRTRRALRRVAADVGDAYERARNAAAYGVKLPTRPEEIVALHLQELGAVLARIDAASPGSADLPRDLAAVRDLAPAAQRALEELQRGLRRAGDAFAVPGFPKGGEIARAAASAIGRAALELRGLGEQLARAPWLPGSAPGTSKNQEQGVPADVEIDLEDLEEPVQEVA